MASAGRDPGAEGISPAPDNLHGRSANVGCFVRDRDLDLAKLQALKDLLSAQFHAKVSRWEDFQAAALGLAGLAFIAYFTKAMSAEALLAVLALAAGAISSPTSSLSVTKGKSRPTLRNCSWKWKGSSPEALKTMKSAAEPVEISTQFRYNVVWPVRAVPHNRRRRRRGLRPLRVSSP